MPLAPPVVAVKPPLAWAGTTFAWDTQISAKILGIGSDYLGAANESAVMAFSLTPSYFVLWRPRHQLSASTRVAVVAELTDSDTSVLKRSAHFADVPLGLDYAATLFSRGHGRSIGGVQTMRDPTLLGEGDWRTWALVSTYLVLPASPESRALGLDLATSVGVGLRQQLKLLGGDSAWLSYLLLTASERWSHAFTSGVDGVLDSSLRSRVLPNTLSHTLAITLPIYRDLNLDSTFQLRTGFAANTGSKGGCVPTATGCVPQPAASQTNVRSSTRFALGLSYQIIPELGVGLGYLNDAPQIGENGLNRSLFHSEYAQFYSNVTFSFDRLYQRLSGGGAPEQPKKRGGA